MWKDAIVTNPDNVICTSHPSPMGQLSGKTPFLGSRIFTTINDKLRGLGLEPIDWKL
jgi:uracil DNA glycosylase